MNLLFKKASLSLLFPFCTLFLFAQTGTIYEGDALLYYLGKSATGNELKNLKAQYNAEMVNETHYVSSGGIELTLKSGTLNEIRLYSKSAVYGSFKGNLPKKLKFGMSSTAVKQFLGKPLVSYRSGYCEFETGAYVFSCWFEGGILSQIGLSLKE